MSAHILLIKNVDTVNLVIDEIGVELLPDASYDARELYDEVILEEDVLSELNSLCDTGKIQISVDGTNYMTSTQSKEYLDIRVRAKQSTEENIKARIQEDYRVYDYCSGYVLEKPIHTINFRTELDTSLHRTELYVYGRLLRRDHYAFDENGDPDLSTNVVTETLDYWLDNKNMVSEGECSLGYWRRDDTLHKNIKVMPWSNDDTTAAEESEHRRSKIVQHLKSSIQAHLIAEGDTASSAYVKGAGLFTEYVDNIRKYIDIADNVILTDISTDTNHTWLDDTITTLSQTFRDYIVESLDYWTAEAADPNLYKGSLLV